MNRFQTAALALMVSCTLASAQDSPAGRSKAAERFLAAVPARDLMQDIEQQMGRGQTPEKQAQLKDVIDNYVDYPELEKTLKGCMVKAFNQDELDALASFYASPAGKSAMRKFGAYMATVMPAIQTELGKAVAKAKNAAPKTP